MTGKKLPPSGLPADARLDTLAVREGLPPSASSASNCRRRCASIVAKSPSLTSPVM